MLARQDAQQVPGDVQRRLMGGELWPPLYRQTPRQACRQGEGAGRGGRLMSRGAQTFKQGDVTKAIKAVVKAGVKDWRLEIGDGKIIVVAGEPDDKTKH